MAKAKKFPSGSWRCLVYSHTEKAYKPDGTVYDKRVYESFTSDDPSPKGKREAELMAANFAYEKEAKKNKNKWPLGTAIDNYIKSKDAVLSQSTIAGYKKIRKNSFKTIMDIPLHKLTNELLQDAVNAESKRMNKRCPDQTVSPKTVKNAYGLITAALNVYQPQLNCTVSLPKIALKIKDLNPPEAIFAVFEDTELELPVLLAMWLSFSVSEIRGLTKSKSLSADGNYLITEETVVKVGTEDIRKDIGKTPTRLRKHRIPAYLKKLINDVPGDTLVPLSYNQLYHKFTRAIEKSGLPHMTFHDLRHVNASVMALLNIPDKYAQERGGWKTDTVMKKVYTHTFSTERIMVDDTVDDYFGRIVQHEMQHETKKAL